jgi:hypothetical protein
MLPSRTYLRYSVRCGGACVNCHSNIDIARATTEPTGFGFAGNALVARLRQDVPSASSYAVVYPVNSYLF